jgi:hypothetical protein
LPNWIWPRQLNASNSAVVRLGRVLHWVALVLSAPSVIFAFGVMFTPDSFRFYITGAFVLIALVCASIGRGVRYILSNE